MGRETMRGRGTPGLTGAPGPSLSGAAARGAAAGAGAAARTSLIAAAKGSPRQPAAKSTAPAIAAARRTRATGAEPTPVSALQRRSRPAVELVGQPLGHLREVRLAGGERAVAGPSGDGHGHAAAPGDLEQPHLAHEVAAVGVGSPATLEDRGQAG